MSFHRCQLTPRRPQGPLHYRMPKITPLAVVPALRPEDVAAASVVRLEPGELIWIDGRLTAGSVSLRPYYFVNEPTSAAAIKGAWIPLGADALSGPVVKFDFAVRAGVANGRIATRRTDAFWILVEEGAAAPGVGREGFRAGRRGTPSPGGRPK